MTKQTPLRQQAQPRPRLSDFQTKIDRYKSDMARVMDEFDWAPAHALAHDLMDCWIAGRQVFLCGNGGSGANAVHIANDYLYGVSKEKGSGLRCHALGANSSVLTCLGNDVGYEHIFSYQLSVMAQPGDVLIALSGSGNSPNILEALKTAQEKNMRSYAILGYGGGQAKSMAGTAIHFPIHDMQISEDLQMVVMHMISQWLYDNRGLVSEG